MPAKFAASFFLATAVAAHGGCYDSPTWTAEPLTQQFIDGESASGASPERVALLNILLRTEDVASQRRARSAHALIPLALQRYEGDRSALRRKLKGGDLSDLVPLLDIKNPNHRTFRPQLVELFWLNGCVEEALDIHSRDPSPSRRFDLMYFAIGDTKTLRTLAAETEGAGIRYVTLAMLLENPDRAAVALASYEAWLDSYVTDEMQPDDQLERFGVESLLAALGNGARPEPPKDFHEHRYAYLAMWFSALGACGPVQRLIEDLNSLPSRRGDHWRTELDVATLRCELGKS